MDANNPSPDGTPEGDTTPKAVGEQVSDFELPGVGDDGIDTFRLSEFTEEGALVLSFYPFDFSPVCTHQLCGFRDAEWLTVTDEVDVVGVSVDSAYSHRQFKNEHDLPFPLLTDRLASMAEAFGVKYDRWEDHPAVCKRAVFALDDSRTVRYRWVTDDAHDQPTLDEVHDAIEWLS